MLHAWLLQGFSLPGISKLMKLSISQRISTAYSRQGPARSKSVSLLSMSLCATLRSCIKFAIHCHALGVTTGEQVSPCHNCTYRGKGRWCKTGLSYHPMLGAMPCTCRCLCVPLAFLRTLTMRLSQSYAFLHKSLDWLCSQLPNQKAIADLPEQHLDGDPYNHHFRLFCLQHGGNKVQFQNSKADWVVSYKEQENV